MMYELVQSVMQIKKYGRKNKDSEKLAKNQAFFWVISFSPNTYFVEYIFNKNFYRSDTYQDMKFGLGLDVFPSGSENRSARSGLGFMECQISEKNILQKHPADF